MERLTRGWGQDTSAGKEEEGEVWRVWEADWC